jgi:hypothetical protein
MLLVRFYRTFAPLPDPTGLPRGPSAVCFCGTVLTVARTGRYPAGLAIGEPGLSSTGRAAAPKTGSPPIAITSPAFHQTLDLPWRQTQMGG